MIVYMFDEEKEFHVFDPRAKRVVASADNFDEAHTFAVDRSSEHGYSFLLMKTEGTVMPKRTAIFESFIAKVA